MSRVRRLLVSHRIFFVTVNLRRSLPFLREEELPLVVEALAESRRRMEFLLCGYVVLPDHWHALIWPRPPLTISRAVQSVKWQAASLLNRKRGRRGTVWQHQFWERFVRHERELAERLDYMHHNPVRRGLVQRPEDWRWSSCNNFSLEKQRVAGCPIPIDYVRMPG
jgi:REP element-mobilizing transposase RayT